MDPYEIDQLLEAVRIQSRDSAIPIGQLIWLKSKYLFCLSIESDVISTRSARLRSPPSTEDENSSVAVANAIEVSAIEWDDVSTARVAPR